MGSAFGGDWKPKKPEDERFFGEPGEIKVTTIPGKKGGYTALTKIGDDGRAVRERHLTDHGFPHDHSNPHDHEISFDPNDGHPLWVKQINYRDISIPEFKQILLEESVMNNTKIYYAQPGRNFESVDDFIFSITNGHESEFSYGELTFDTGYFRNQYHIYNIDCPEESDQGFDTPEEMLNFLIDGIPLREIVTKVYVWNRMI